MESTNSSVNFTIVFNRKITKQGLEFCERESATFETVDSTVPYIVNATLNAPLSITATFLNVLAFLAIRQSHNLRLPSKLLLCSLILTDIGVGLITQPLLIAFLISKVKSYASVQCFIIATFVMTSNVLGCTSVMIMTAISIDRYVALHCYLRYREIVTTKRVSAALVIAWSLGVVFASLWLWNTTLHIALPMVTYSICFLIISFNYMKIYRGLREQARRRVRDFAQVSRRRTSTLNVARYRRTTAGMVWIKILFVLCYLPYGCVMLVIQFAGLTAVTQCILEFSATFIHLNACLNPFVYCLHLPEMRSNFLRRLPNICAG